MTLAQKIVARAAGTAHVEAGEFAVCQVDLAMAHDSSGPRRWRTHFEALGAKVWDPDKLVLAADHYAPATDRQSQAIVALTREFAAAQGVSRYYESQGISHTLLAENGSLRPGMFCAGGDSHSPQAGAFACFSIGLGATDMLGVIVTGRTWVITPHTDRLAWSGHLSERVTAKDMMLFLCARLGQENAGAAAEFTGEAVAALAMDERMVLTNMTAELGYDTGLIAADARTLSHLRAAGAAVHDDALAWRSDDAAAFRQHLRFDATALVPHVAAPHSPANSAPVSAHAGQPIHHAYIGACVGAKMEDLRMAAAVLEGRRVARAVRLLVAPASARIARQAAAEGVLDVLACAGATLLPTGCGACAGMGAGVLGKGEISISTTSRNFQGRMGHAESQVYLASPYTVAASAVEGRIADPREHGPR